MIPVEYYSTVYFLLLFVMVMVIVLNLFTKTEASNYINTQQLNGWAYFIITFLILYIGLRDPYGSWKYLGDTSAYTAKYNEILHHRRNIEIKDVGFHYLMVLCSFFVNIQIFFVICAALYIIPVFLAFKKWFNNYSFYALILYVTALSFWGFGMNGVRNGIAASFFIFALSFEKKKLLRLLIIIIAISFHKSMILPSIALYLSPYIKNTWLLIAVWFSSIIISFIAGYGIYERLGVFIEGSEFSDDKATNSLFTQNVEGGVALHTFRADFILYSAVPIVFAWYFMRKKEYTDPFYKKIVNIYIMTNTIWVLLIYVAFTNRLAYLSWCLMPVVFVYPLLKQKLLPNQFKKIAFIILGSLAFTIFMLVFKS